MDKHYVLLATIRGMDIDEQDVQEGEKIKKEFEKKVLSSGDATLIRIIRTLPEESYAKLKNILADSEDI